jgi:hypothetical protein
MLLRRSLGSKDGRSKSGTSSGRRHKGKDEDEMMMSKDQMVNLMMAMKASGMPKRRSVKVKKVLMEAMRRARRIQKQNLLQLRR